MKKYPSVGKINRGAFDSFVLNNLGARRSDVLVAPAYGVDVGVVKVGHAVLVVKIDPLAIVPQLGWDKSGWAAFHLLASDITTSGLAPSFMMLDMNLPKAMDWTALGKINRAISDECKRYGVAIVGGHTARYGGVDYPIVGSASMFAVGENGRYVTSQMATIDDDVLITKSLGIESAVYLSHFYPEKIVDSLGRKSLNKIRNMFYQLTTVDDALAAAKVGIGEDGVTAMHDATEGGVFNAVYEIAEASGLGVEINYDELPMEDAVVDILSLFKIDPCRCSSEGTLVLTVKPQKTFDVMRALVENGIRVSKVGKIKKGIHRILIKNGRKHPLTPTLVDPYWRLISKAKPL
jgi:hydrogenase expression/formation protein HypE